MNWLFVPQASQSSPYRRAKSDIWLAIPPALENACGMEISMVKNIKNYLRKRVGEYVVNEDGMGVVEVVLIIIVLISLVAIFKTEISAVVRKITGTMKTNAYKI